MTTSDISNMKWNKSALCEFLSVQSNKPHCLLVWGFKNLTVYALLKICFTWFEHSKQQSTKQRHGWQLQNCHSDSANQKTYISQELCNWLALSGLLVKRTRFESPSPIYCNNWIIKNKNKKYIEFSKYLIIISLS